MAAALGYGNLSLQPPSYSQMLPPPERAPGFRSAPYARAYQSQQLMQPPMSAARPMATQRFGRIEPSLSEPGGPDDMGRAVSAYADPALRRYLQQPQGTHSPDARLQTNEQTAGAGLPLGAQHPGAPRRYEAVALTHPAPAMPAEQTGGL